MNLLTIAWKSIRQRAVGSSLTALSVALGVTLMVAVLVISGVVERMFNQTATGYDLVVGPKGSPLQLVLNTIYHVSVPVENLPYLYYKQLKQNRKIEHAIPCAMGDVTQEGNFRIVGIIPEFFELEYMPDKFFRTNGRFLARPFEAVIGSVVARQNGWKIGDEFAPVHGISAGESAHVHDEKFKIVGVLAPTGTPNDKVVYIHLEGFYQIAGHEKPAEEAAARAKQFAAAAGESLEPEHAPGKPGAAEEPDAAHAEEAGHDHDHDHAGHQHHALSDAQKEVTSILVRTKHPNLARMLQTEINEGPYAQATNPIQQISWLMRNVLGNIRDVMIAMTSLIIVVSGVGIFVSIYNSMSDRRREIAIMRALGARRSTVFSIILAESVLLCVGGGVLGMLLGHGLALVSAPIVEGRSGILINPFAFEPLELVLIPVLILLAALVGVIPGIRAYRTDVARTLGS